MNALLRAAKLPGLHAQRRRPMARFKKTANKTTGKAGNAQAQAERLSKTLSESAQQIWLAGVGAFGRAQAEGA